MENLTVFCALPQYLSLADALCAPNSGPVAMASIDLGERKTGTMKLDELYSGLTLATSAKLALVGLGAWAISQKTAKVTSLHLEAARTQISTP